MSDVVELDPNDPKATVCGTCGRGWDDSISTSVTPTPAGRCPFEYDHVYDDNDEIPIGAEVETPDLTPVFGDPVTGIFCGYAEVQSGVSWRAAIVKIQVMGQGLYYDDYRLYDPELITMKEIM